MEYKKYKRAFSATVFRIDLEKKGCVAPNEEVSNSIVSLLISPCGVERTSRDLSGSVLYSQRPGTSLRTSERPLRRFLVGYESSSKRI